MTAVPKAILRAITERDGHLSAWTGLDVDTLVPHHRANRGMGGGAHRLSNIVWLESDINGLIESDGPLAEEARARGIKISKFSNPAAEPIIHAVHGRCLLDDDGRMHNGIEVF